MGGKAAFIFYVYEISSIDTFNQDPRLLNCKPVRINGSITCDAIAIIDRIIVVLRRCTIPSVKYRE